MQRVIALCGLAFSGKSTAARHVAEALECDLISLDATNNERGLDGGRGLSVEQWEETSAIAMGRLGSRLAAGRSVVVDDTFSHRVLRERCRDVAEAHGCAFTILFMDTPLAAIQSRRAANDRDARRTTIDDAVFEAHRTDFQVPGTDEPVVRIGSDGALEAWLARQRGRS